MSSYMSLYAGQLCSQLEKLAPDMAREMIGYGEFLLATHTTVDKEQPDEQSKKQPKQRLQLVVMNRCEEGSEQRTTGGNRCKTRQGHKHR